MVIAGGTATLLGPIAGAALVVVVKNVASAYIERWNFVLGAIFVVIVVFMPEGLVPGTARRWRRAMAALRPRATAAGGPARPAPGGPRQSLRDRAWACRGSSRAGPRWRARYNGWRSPASVRATPGCRPWRG